LFNAGIMQACCDTAFDYAHQRKQFGTPIGEFQLIQAKMADMYTNLNVCRYRTEQTSVPEPDPDPIRMFFDLLDPDQDQ
jgi:alkylation response protein AidB-like acyl-CoA dehydrogenase